MKLSIEAPAIQPAQPPRNGGRTNGANDDAVSDRRFQDCLAEASSDSNTRVRNERPRTDKRDERERDDDSIGDDARERARRLADHGQIAVAPAVVTPPPPPPAIDPTSAPAALGLADGTLEPVGDAGVGALAVAADVVVDPQASAVDLAGVEAALLEAAEAAEAIDAATATAALALAEAAADAATTAPSAVPASVAAENLLSDVVGEPPAAPAKSGSADPALPSSSQAGPVPEDVIPTDAMVNPATIPTTPSSGERVAAAQAAVAAESAALAESAVAGGSAKRPTSSNSSVSSGSSSVARSATVTGTEAGPAGQPSAFRLDAAAAASTTAAPLPPPPVLGANAVAARLGGPLQLDVDLGGEGLGPLRMRARAVGSELHVSLAAGDAHVRSALINHASGLRRDLEAAGLDLASLNVGGSPDQQPGADNDPNHGAANGGAGSSGAHSSPGRESARTSSSATGAAPPTLPRPISTRLDLKL